MNLKFLTKIALLSLSVALVAPMAMLTAGATVRRAELNNLLRKSAWTMEDVKRAESLKNSLGAHLQEQFGPRIDARAAEVSAEIDLVEGEAATRAEQEAMKLKREEAAALKVKEAEAAFKMEQTKARDALLKANFAAPAGMFTSIKSNETPLLIFDIECNYSDLENEDVINDKYYTLLKKQWVTLEKEVGKKGDKDWDALEGAYQEVRPHYIKEAKAMKSLIDQTKTALDMLISIQKSTKDKVALSKEQNDFLCSLDVNQFSENLTLITEHVIPAQTRAKQFVAGVKNNKYKVLIGGGILAALAGYCYVRGGGKGAEGVAAQVLEGAGEMVGGYLGGQQGY